MLHFARRRDSAAALAAAAFVLCLSWPGSCAPRADDLRPRIERGLDRAAAYLLSMQDADGAWRSATYGALADGMSITPAVLKTVMLGPPGEPARSAVQRGAAYLRGRVGADGTIAAQPVLDYPVYTASLAVIVLNRLAADAPQDRDAIGAARDAWAAYLKEFQLTERLGWARDDAAFGGWGYSVQPPRLPDQDRPPFDADLSSTLFAVGALRLCGLGADDPVIEDALRFVERCQNFAEGAQRDPLHDDGGFFFTPTNAAQNKAGAAGADRHGVMRYHSYGTATADGLRALVRCGVPPGHPRVLAARAWLERHFTPETNPGVFEPALAADRDAAWHYWCWSASHALRLLGASTIEHNETQVPWAAPLAEALLARQRTDGSWANPLTFMKEDDPLVATSLAAAALANCRDAMWLAE